MNSAVSIRPANSIIFINDPSMPRSVSIPMLDEKIVSANEWCVCIGTYPAPDGPTTIEVVDDGLAINLAGVKVFDGTVRTPSCHLGIFTAEDVCVLRWTVPTLVTHMRAFVDDRQFPERITVITRR